MAWAPTKVFATWLPECQVSAKVLVGGKKVKKKKEAKAAEQSAASCFCWRL